MVDADQIQFRPRQGLQHIGKRQLQWSGEERGAWSLHREHKTLLQQPGRHHVAHQLRRHRGDAHLGVVENLAIFTDGGAGLHHQLDQLTLLLSQVGGPLRCGGNDGWLIWGDGSQHLGADAWQVHLGSA